MLNDSLLEMLIRGGFTIFILAMCSIFSIKVMIEKLIQFKGIKTKFNDDLLQQVLDKLEAKNLKDAIFVCKNYKITAMGIKVPSPLAKVLQNVLEHLHLSKEELIEYSYNKLDQELANLEKGLGVLATLGSISPFIGLFGTVVGIIKSFSALSLTDTSNYAHVMSGIAEALIATAAGLFVAVPAVMFYNYFMKKLKLSMPSFDEAIHGIIRIVKSSK
jgi:biopolymer transport protein ExbB/TolQ